MENQENFIPKQEEEKGAARLMTPEEMIEVTNHLLSLQNKGMGNKTIDQAVVDLLNEIDLRKKRGQSIQYKVKS